ncbi:BTB/POZ domain-containing protein 9 [Pelomyxa schiedti]|nr:BTB/POZ domain-containing protein 9 [Pelomyxa schiedti]
MTFLSLVCDRLAELLASLDPKLVPPELCCRTESSTDTSTSTSTTSTECTTTTTNNNNNSLPSTVPSSSRSFWVLVEREGTVLRLDFYAQTRLVSCGLEHRHVDEAGRLCDVVCAGGLDFSVRTMRGVAGSSPGGGCGSSVLVWSVAQNRLWSCMEEEPVAASGDGAASGESATETETEAVAVAPDAPDESSEELTVSASTSGAVVEHSNTCGLHPIEDSDPGNFSALVSLLCRSIGFARSSNCLESSTTGPEVCPPPPPPPPPPHPLSANAPPVPPPRARNQLTHVVRVLPQPVAKQTHQEEMMAKASSFKSAFVSTVTSEQVHELRSGYNSLASRNFPIEETAEFAKSAYALSEKADNLSPSQLAAINFPDDVIVELKQVTSIHRAYQTITNTASTMNIKNCSDNMSFVLAQYNTITSSFRELSFKSSNFSEEFLPKATDAIVHCAKLFCSFAEQKFAKIPPSTSKFGMRSNLSAANAALSIIITMHNIPTILAQPWYRSARASLTQTVNKMQDMSSGLDVSASSATVTDISTSLWNACSSASLKEVTTLIAKGASVNSTFQGIPCLHAAIKAGSLPVVKLLLENVADTNAILENTKETALHLACKTFNIPLTKLLIEHGADFTVPDAFNNLPLPLLCNAVSPAIPSTTFTPAPFMQHLGRFLFNKEFSDVVLVVEGQDLYAHRIVLSGQCDFFHRMLSGAWKEGVQSRIVLEDTDLQAFRAFLVFLYTTELSVKFDDQQGLLNLHALAVKYGHPSLQKACETSLHKQLNAENVMLIYQSLEYSQSLTAQSELLKASVLMLLRNYHLLADHDGGTRPVLQQALDSLAKIKAESNNRL